MIRRRGFTLIELIVALALTGVIALLVYGSASIAFDTRDRLEAEELQLRSDIAARALITDVLRNARSPREFGEATVVLEPGGVVGRPRDRLTIITSGGMPPLTGDADWRVLIEATDAGIAISATPVGIDALTIRMIGLNEVSGLDARVRGGGSQESWFESWLSPQTLPSAVELTFWTAGRPIADPLVVAMPLGVER